MSNIIDYSNLGMALRADSDAPLAFDEMDWNFKFLALCCKLQNVSSLKQDSFTHAVAMINAEESGELTAEGLTTFTQTFNTQNRYYGAFVRLTSLTLVLDDNAHYSVTGVFNIDNFIPYETTLASSTELIIADASVNNTVYVVFNTFNLPS